MTAFVATIGIDYSGAETPTSSLKGLRGYEARGGALRRRALAAPDRTSSP